MSDFDTLPDTYPDAQGPSLTGAAGKKCYRHQWWPQTVVTFPHGIETHTVTMKCLRCPAIRDEARAKRGKSAGRQGKDAEREIARATGGVRVGHHGGPVDVFAPTPRRFAIQSKRVTAPSLARAEVARKAVFPEWMWDELRALPVTGGDVPALIVSDKPGPGGRRRSLVVVDYRDYVELYGEPE